MHRLQPKQTKLTHKDKQELLSRLNISVSQLPKISIKDPTVPENSEAGDILKIERKTERGVQEYFRVIT